MGNEKEKKGRDSKRKRKRRSKTPTGVGVFPEDGIFRETRDRRQEEAGRLCIRFVHQGAQVLQASGQAGRHGEGRTRDRGALCEGSRSLGRVRRPLLMFLWWHRVSQLSSCFSSQRARLQSTQGFNFVSRVKEDPGLYRICREKNPGFGSVS